MPAFDPATGCVGSRCPPFNSQAEVDGYMTALLTSGMGSTGSTELEGKGITASVDIRGNNFPSVQVIRIGTGQAVVYVNPNGQSMFSYKNDPTNQFKLITGGVQVLPAPVTDVAQVKTGNPSWGWGIVIVVIVIIIVIVIVVASRRRKTLPANA
jgi:hypothetical protein